MQNCIVITVASPSGVLMFFTEAVHRKILSRVQTVIKTINSDPFNESLDKRRALFQRQYSDRLHLEDTEHFVRKPLS